jgi:hypothetical protein
MPKRQAVGATFEEVKFKYHTKGVLSGKLRERLKIFGDLRVGMKKASPRRSRRVSRMRSHARGRDFHV